MYTYDKPRSSRVEKYSTRETEGRNSQVAQLQKLQSTVGNQTLIQLMKDRSQMGGGHAVLNTGSVLQCKGGHKKMAKSKRQRKERAEQIALDHELRTELFAAREEASPERTDTFHQYGDDHRNPEVNPDESEGVNGVYLGGHRADDAPVVDTFRMAYNRLDSWLHFLEKTYPNVMAEVEDAIDLERRKEILKEIKIKTKAYKTEYRKLDNTGYLDDLNHFFLFVVEMESEILDMTEEIERIARRHRIGETDDEIHEQGTEIWRKRWHTAIQEINTVIEALWPSTEAKLHEWMEKQAFIRNKDHTLELDYIGSLAKGYKGPPKQHIRFDPTDFDVDANLYAPALAEYAVRVDGQTPDRERIFGRNTSIRPLHDFSDKIQKELVNRIDGIEEDPNDLFDVAIYATSTPEQLDHENRLQELYDFRGHTPNNLTNYTTFIDRLQRAGLLVRGEEGLRLKESLSAKQKALYEQIKDDVY